MNMAIVVAALVAALAAGAVPASVFGGGPGVVQSNVAPSASSSATGTGSVFGGGPG